MKSDSTVSVMFWLYSSKIEKILLKNVLIEFLGEIFASLSSIS